MGMGWYTKNLDTTLGVVAMFVFLLVLSALVGYGIWRAVWIGA